MPTSFLRDESGNVTIDWVVLSAGVAGLAVAAVTVVGFGAEARSDGFVTQTAIWRKGSYAKENYDAHRHDSFMAMFQLAGDIDAADLASMNGYANAYRGSDSYENWSAAGQKWFDDMDASIAAYHAEEREMRSSEQDFESERLERLWQDHYGQIAQTYQ